MTVPFLFAKLSQSARTQIVLNRSLSVGKVTPFHGHHDVVHDQGRSKASTQPQEQHCSSLITPKGLHRCIIHEPHRTSECCREIETQPSRPEVGWFRSRPPIENLPWIADGDGVIGPIVSKLLNSRDHFGRRQPWPRGKFSARCLPTRQDLYACSTDINNKYFHERACLTDRGASSVHPSSVKDFITHPHPRNTVICNRDRNQRKKTPCGIRRSSRANRD